MTSQNLARCQVPWWEPGMVPSHVTYIGNLPKKARDMGVRHVTAPKTTFSWTLDFIFMQGAPVRTPLQHHILRKSTAVEENISRDANVFLTIYFILISRSLSSHLLTSAFLSHRFFSPSLRFTSLASYGQIVANQRLHAAKAL